LPCGGPGWRPTEHSCSLYANFDGHGPRSWSSASVATGPLREGASAGAGHENSSRPDTLQPGDGLREEVLRSASNDRVFCRLGQMGQRVRDHRGRLQDGQCLPAEQCIKASRPSDALYTRPMIRASSPGVGAGREPPKDAPTGDIAVGKTTSGRRTNSSIAARMTTGY